MSSATMIEWIFEDSRKQDREYKGIITSPFTKQQDVAEQLQDLRMAGLEKGDKRIDTFLRKYTMEQALEYAQPEIDKLNTEWQNQFEKAVERQEDIEFLKDKLDTEKSRYEETTSNFVENLLDRAVVEIPEVFKPSQAGAISDVLGVPSEEVQGMGIRAVQQALEGEFFGRIAAADTEDELDDLLDDLDTLPTKAGVARLKRDIKDRRRELG